MNPGTMLLLLAAPLAQMDDEFQYAFGGGELHPALTRFGPNAAQAMANKPGGLLIALSADRQEKGAVGIEPRFGISGDFEITLDYEILSVEKPSTGIGAGVKLWGQIQSGEFQAITLGHMMDPEGKIEFGAIFAEGRDVKKRQYKQKVLSTEAKRGRLRLARTGSELSFLAAEEDKDAFQEIQRVSAGRGDVTPLRISANTSGAACGVTVRLANLRIRAEDLPGEPTKLRRSTSRGWLVVWLLVIAVVGTGAALSWRYRSVLSRYWPWQR